LEVGKAHTCLSLLLCLLLIVALSPVSAGGRRRDNVRFEVEFPYGSENGDGGVENGSSDGGSGGG
jgi:hypothetical protein